MNEKGDCVMRKSMIAVLLAGSMTLGACTSVDDARMSDVATGAAVGAAGGAAVGALTGGVGVVEGAAVGAAMTQAAQAFLASLDEQARTKATMAFAASVRSARESIRTSRSAGHFAKAGVEAGRGLWAGFNPIEPKLFRKSTKCHK